MVALTEKQLQLVRLVWTFRRDRGHAPTLRDLGKRLRISTVSVWERVHALLEKRVLVREKGGRARLLLDVPGPVAEEVGLLEARHERIRARAAAVARAQKCQTACAHLACARIEGVALALERMDLGSTL